MEDLTEHNQHDSGEEKGMPPVSLCHNIPGFLACCCNINKQLQEIPEHGSYNVNYAFLVLL